MWLHGEVGHNHEAADELKNIFGESVFNNPKPTRLLKHILNITTSNDDIILDSFAGSGTTGQAVLELNQEDGGNRQFILVEMEDYANNLTAERLRRVIHGIPNAKDSYLQEGLKGTFSFFDLGPPLDIDAVLSGSRLPTYTDLARYLFYTATGEEFDPTMMNEERSFVGESTQFRVYLLYKSDLAYLRSISLTLDIIEALPDDGTKTRLIFAPTRYVDSEYLEAHHVKYAQLPFEIYRFHY